METIYYQEILIAHSSDFFSREFFLNERTNHYQNLLPVEQLTEACWNGILSEILPEVTTRLHLSEINEGNKFLNVCLGNESDRSSVAFSVNPYFFLNSSRKN